MVRHTFWTVAFALCAVLGLASAVPLNDAPSHPNAMKTEQSFTVEGTNFMLDGEPFRIMGGAIHYWRVHPDYWEDRIMRLKAMGLNVLETYVPWNLHEPSPGQFDFEGALDIVRFIELCEEADMLVIVRPGPYVCAEFEFGGLPGWLLKDPSMRIRTADQDYMNAFGAYLDQVLTRVVPLQYNLGSGPVIALQIENEYGYYGNDKVYLTHLYETFLEAGVVSVVITSDGPADIPLQGGSLMPEVLATVNFDNNPVSNIENLRRYQPNAPAMVTELWAGWFTFWNGNYETRDPQSVADLLDDVLAQNASAILYMAHGGTNFGFTNGATSFDGAGGGVIDVIRPVITSYDYDAPVGEAGECGKKFELIQEVISKHLGTEIVPAPPQLPKAAYGSVILNESVRLLDALDDVAHKIVHNPFTLSLEQLDQNFGFVYYHTRVPNISPDRLLGILQIRRLADRAHAFVNQQFQSILNPTPVPTLSVEIPAGGADVGFLVESAGRSNFGPGLEENVKGIARGVTFNNQFLADWTMYSLPLETEDIARLEFSEGVKDFDSPTFYRGTFSVSGEPADTYLRCDGWSKGVAYVNGFNIGRYWPDVGPQMTLYIPAPLLRSGTNELVLFELDGAHPDAMVTLVDVPDLAGDGSQRP